MSAIKCPCYSNQLQLFQSLQWVNKMDEEEDRLSDTQIKWYFWKGWNKWDTHKIIFFDNLCVCHLFYPLQKKKAIVNINNSKENDEKCFLGLF